jgi:hypothetical protein
MKRLLSVICLLSSVLCSLSSGAELTDLGQGLSYLRIHSVGDSESVLRKAVPGAGALVLDLRYATADETAAATLKSALASRSSGALLLVLVSPATPAALTPVITAPPALTLGAPGSVPAPKIIVRTDAAVDRKAYDALDAGTELSKLVTGKIEKDRFDEATLVKEFKNDHDALPGDRPGQTPAGLPGNPAERGISGTNTGPAAAGNGASVTGAPGAEDTPREIAVVAPTDRVLQRAIHLHRAMLALRR